MANAMNMDGKLETTRPIYILDRMNEPYAADPLYAFALDELLCRQTGTGGPAVCHLWRHPSAFIMGLRDSRLPCAPQAKERLEAEGWSVAVRNSGGAAVPLDSGVVNVSLILPKNGSAGEHFHGDFERMYRLIADALAATGRRIDKGEIAGSYCPGDYDLSIGGFKFCGIAQRRQLNAYIVQAFVIVEGDGRQRAETVRSFYRIAADGAEPGQYPIVRDDKMASLEQLADLMPGSAVPFANEVKEVVRRSQSPEADEAAAAAFRMPEEERIRELAESLRHRYEIK
ncbi:biotin/lipoate A/B protein ligase family protein [Paenibacillus thailandensis]|uniref:Biotin/lipoate A/B protein ligase family protein n=1 Tax=Paenibacillus thailandensis TaxID=393250 RepID=A0ABW5QWE8_9BACL